MPTIFCICPKCGYFGSREIDKKNNKCLICGETAIRTNLTAGEYYSMNDEQAARFVSDFQPLEKYDPDAWEKRLQYLEDRRKRDKVKIEEDLRKLNRIKHRTCPYCGCDQFTPVRRKWNILTGFYTNKIDLICNNCGKKVD
ncbi:hypothetical protein [Anaerolentibacter hominis]|uniref:hypothetical protein n=1 Tax=Anaerolentibacter hominis TaxID=3079009 RepID=UPI0031B85433